MSTVYNSVSNWTIDDARSYCIKNYGTGCAQWCPMGFCGTQHKVMCEVKPFRWPKSGEEDHGKALDS